MEEDSPGASQAQGTAVQRRAWRGSEDSGGVLWPLVPGQESYPPALGGQEGPTGHPVVSGHNDMYWDPNNDPSCFSHGLSL